MRSRGPGGQNVNKTNSACLLRWNLHRTYFFDEQTKQRLLEKLSGQLTELGDLLIRSDQFRDQEANRKACIAKLVEVIDRALIIPKPRKKTRPKRSAVQKRLKGKELRGEKKALRQKVRH